MKQKMDLYTVLIDLIKAFDMVNQDVLCIILTKHGCPRKFTWITCLYYNGMTVSVLTSMNGTSSAPFDMPTGVKQDCMLTPILFKLFFSCILTHVIQNFNHGIYLKYRLDGSLFDLQGLNIKTKLMNTTILELLFVDECAPMVHTESDLQFIMSKFTEAAQLFDLTISLSKTDVLYQPAPGSVAPPPSVHNDITYLTPSNTLAASSPLMALWARKS